MTTSYQFIGDVHGKFIPYLDIVRRSDRPTIQVGDMGIGFPTENGGLSNVTIPSGHHFIRGNHDSPKVCERNMACLREGYHSRLGVFVIPGAYSIDQHCRTPGVDYWEDEELSYVQLSDLVDLYTQIRPEIVVSHTCPTDLFPYIARPGETFHPYRTPQALSMMFNIHAPKLWVFGHFHRSTYLTLGKTTVVGLDELETYTYDGHS